jgi:hypothetical protein
VPIVVTQPAPDTLFGYGHEFEVHTTTVGPFVPPVEWRGQIFDTDGVTDAGGALSFGVEDPHLPSSITFTPGFGTVKALTNQFQQGGNAQLRVQMLVSSAVVEQISVPIKFDTTAWQYLHTQTSTTDLTPVLDDTTQLLSDTGQLLSNWNQYLAVTLPSLNDILNGITAGVTATFENAGNAVSATLGQIFSITSAEFWQDRDLSGGTTCEHVDYDASFNALYGVSVIVDSYPPDWEFKTPDHAWGFHDLAVLTFVRGGAVIERHGIHRVSHTVSPLPQFPWPWQSALPIAFQPGDTHIQVDWADGVCGRLIGHVLP